MDSHRLSEYVLAHTIRGECKCGRCIDVGTTPDPTGPHTIDLTFFKVALPPEQPALVVADFRQLIAEHIGVFTPVDVFDGKEHNFMELGGWLGDQGLALQFMGLGVLLGVFELWSPDTVLPDMPPDLKQQMAALGMVAIVARVAHP
jgi:hypothetical protein